MKIFISGATGYIGSRLAIRLADEGHIIHALYRSESKVGPLKHTNIKLFKGDILDVESLSLAMTGCEEAYHTAAFAKVWDKNPSKIYRLNIEGAVNVIRCGIELGVKMFVCTSTAGVFGPSGKNLFVDESSKKPSSYFIDYESSKALLEVILKAYSLAGVHIVIVNPTRVYGPGILSESNGVTRMIKKYTEGKWHLIPGDGQSPGNYVHVEDVVSGHILAMEKGVSGENYLLGGSNVSYNELFKGITRVSEKKYQLFHVPLWIMILISKIMLSLAKITGNDPLITPPLVKKFMHHWNVKSDKAIRDLGYNPMSFEEGLKDTLNWLNKE